MSKIEKTLELNITHELLTLADSFWWFLQPISLQKYWRPHWRFPIIETPKSFATGLHINLEGKKNGGYDVCINSPPTFQGGKPRLLFMQFKAGIEQPFNSNTSSIFFGNERTPNKHIEFEINSNARRNQHHLLQELATRSGNKDAVVYVFPRIVNEYQLIQNIGNLISKTSFISIADIDAKAKSNGIVIDDGNPHKFRTCYNDYDRNEINLLLFLYGRINNPGKQIGEIFAVRMYRSLYSLKKVQIPEYPILRHHIMDAMIRHVLNLGLTLSVHVDYIEDYFKKYPGFDNRLDYFDEFDGFPKSYSVERPKDDYGFEIFKDILQSLSQYFKWIDTISDFVDEEIPQPPSEHSIIFNEKEIRFSLETDGESDLIEDGLDDVSYCLF